MLGLQHCRNTGRSRDDLTLNLWCYYRVTAQFYIRKLNFSHFFGITLISHLSVDRPPHIEMIFYFFLHDVEKLKLNLHSLKYKKKCFALTWKVDFHIFFYSYYHLWKKTNTNQHFSSSLFQCRKLLFIYYLPNSSSKYQKKLLD